MMQHAVPSSVGKDGLRQRVCWLIRLRWLAAVGVILGTFLAKRVFDIPVREAPLYGIAVLLFVYNGFMRVFLARVPESINLQSTRRATRLINFQILADLVLLTVMLHFSGGPENPFVLFFIFHMIIASILLPTWMSYLQATVAIALLGALLWLEYSGLIPHYCLKGLVAHCRYDEPAYLLAMFCVFAVTLYLVVYMTSYIAVRLRRAEQTQRQVNDLLREKDRIKDEYVAHLTHDIKGHLAAIQSCLGVAITGTISGQPAEFVGRAYRRTQKLTSFVRMLLKLTRLRLDGTVGGDVFPMGEAVREAVGTVRSRAEHKSIDLECQIERVADIVCGHKASVEEAVANLLLNAIKYTPAHGMISVAMKTQGAKIMVEISDTGIGVPQAEQARIFEEFFRASNAKQIEPNGTGLGLSLAKQVIELHGGTIDFSSVEGKGTTFRILVPRAVASFASEPDGRTAGATVNA